MMTEIIRELTAVMKSNEITTEKILAWTKWVKVQKVQKVLLEATEANSFMPCKGMNKRLIHLTEQNQLQKNSHIVYTVGTQMLRRCPACGKRCSWCDKVNHFEKICRSQGTDPPQEMTTYQELFMKHIKAMKGQVTKEYDICQQMDQHYWGCQTVNG